MLRPGSQPAASTDAANTPEPPFDADADADDAVLPGGASVDIAAMRAEFGVDHALTELDESLVGLAPVKNRLHQIEALLLVDRLRHRFGLESPRPNLHMCFAGPPGTGKTTVATKMAEILHDLGYLPSDRLVTVSRDDLVGQYVGHTAPKTKDVLRRAMGGVLFIDEAYTLHRPDNERDYGQEAIEILLQVMENDRDRLVVVLAGYRDRMDAFFDLNPGLRSRITHHVDFPEFAVDELIAIGQRMLVDQGYRLSAAAEPVFREYVERRRGQQNFANARSIRNAIERTRLRHAARLVDAGGTVDRQALEVLEPADLLGSAVFDADTGPAPTTEASE